MQEGERAAETSHKMRVCRRGDPRWTGHVSRSGRSPRLDGTEVYKSLYTCTSDVKIKWLPLRILHRILPTNKMLHFMGKKKVANVNAVLSQTKIFIMCFGVVINQMSFGRG